MSTIFTEYQTVKNKKYNQIIESTGNKENRPCFNSTHKLIQQNERVAIIKKLILIYFDKKR